MSQHGAQVNSPVDDQIQATIKQFMQVGATVEHGPERPVTQLLAKWRGGNSINI